jgi:small subunit ribosomal protein S6
LRRYETLFIVQVDLPDDELSNLIERYSSIITAFKGTVVKTEKWGKRKLAYQIRKQTNGYYILIDFAGKSAVIEEMERNFKIDDKVLKFMTILKDDKVDLAKIEKEKLGEVPTDTPRVALKVESPETPVKSMEIERVKDSTSSESI